MPHSLFGRMQIMEKSNFKMLTDKENKTARSRQYLLDVPIIVDKQKV